MATYEFSLGSYVVNWANFGRSLKDTGTGTNITIAPLASATLKFGVLTDSGTPNSDSWESGGTQTVTLDVDASNMNIRCRAAVGRTADAFADSIQEGTVTGFQTLDSTGDFTFTPSAPTWTGGEEDCENRYYVVLEFNNLDDMMQQSVRFNFQTSTVVTNITEDGGTCGGAPARRIFIVS